MARNGKANALQVNYDKNGQAFIKKKPLRDNAMDEIMDQVNEQGLSITEVSNRALISATTLYKWRKGQTRYPQHMSLVCVARAFGMGYKLVRINDPDE